MYTKATGRHRMYFDHHHPHHPNFVCENEDNNKKHAIIKYLWLVKMFYAWCKWWRFWYIFIHSIFWSKGFYTPLAFIKIFNRIFFHLSTRNKCVCRWMNDGWVIWKMLSNQLKIMYNMFLNGFSPPHPIPFNAKHWKGSTALKC